MPIPIRALAACVLLALALVPAACGGDKKETPSTAATAVATPSRPDPATLSRQAADAVERLNSFHFVLEHENGGTPIDLGLTMNRAEGDFLKPDRLRADIDAVASQLGNTKIKAKVVGVGNQAKITNPFAPSQYVALPGKNSLADLFDPSAGTTAAMRAVKNPQITGEETINGVPVWRIEGDVDATALKAFANLAEPGYTVKGTTWIGKERPLVHRIRLDGPLGSKDAKGIVRKIDLSKFDEPVTIELP